MGRCVCVGACVCVWVPVGQCVSVLVGACITDAYIGVLDNVLESSCVSGCCGRGGQPAVQPD